MISIGGIEKKMKVNALALFRFDAQTQLNVRKQEPNLGEFSQNLLFNNCLVAL